MRHHGISFIAIAILVSPVIGGVASAEPTQRTVDYSDLELSNSEDAAELVRRLDYASRTVCGGSPRNDANFRIARQFVTEAFEQCRREALQDAIAEFQSPSVQRAYAQSGLGRTREG